MSVYQRHSLLKALGKYDQCLIDRTVAVRVVLTHRITDDTRRFPVRLVVPQMQLPHIVKDAALYRFQTIPRIRNGAGRDDTHRVVHIAALHFL